MVQIEVVYQGSLQCTAQHGPSKVELTTDAPVDNHGLGSSFSPTDLLATALGTCVLTTIGIRTRERNFPLEGMRIEVRKHMTASAPRRIARLEVELWVPHAHAYAPADRELIENIAHTCPVRLSLLDAIDVPVVIHW